MPKSLAYVAYANSAHIRSLTCIHSRALDWGRSQIESLPRLRSCGTLALQLALGTLNKKVTSD